MTPTPPPMWRSPAAAMSRHSSIAAALVAGVLSMLLANTHAAVLKYSECGCSIYFGELPKHTVLLLHECVTVLCSDMSGH